MPGQIKVLQELTFWWEGQILHKQSSSRILLRLKGVGVGEERRAGPETSEGGQEGLLEKEPDSFPREVKPEAHRAPHPSL